MTTPHTHSPTLLKPVKPVGIVGYGAYVPRYRLPAREVARVGTNGVSKRCERHPGNMKDFKNKT